MVKKTWTLWDSFKVQGPSLAPIMISAAVLIGLILYTLIRADAVSQEDQKIIMYTELVLSFIASIFVIMLSSVFILGGKIDLYLLLLLLTSPFVLTCIRAILQAYAQNKTSDQVLSVMTILSTLYYSLMLFGFAFGSLINKPWF